MANRTLQFFGIGYGAEPVTVAATLNGVQVFNGTIQTFDSATNTTDPWTQVTYLFSAEVDQSTLSDMPMVVTATGGTAVVGDVYANYIIEKNPIYSNEQFLVLMNTNATGSEISDIMSQYASPAFTAEELVLVQSKNPADSTARKALLNSKNLEPYSFKGADVFERVWTDVDTRSNVVLGGVPVTDSDPHAYKPAPSNRPVYWGIDNGVTMSCMINLPVLQGLNNHTS
jgi:hypothetical protein